MKPITILFSMLLFLSVNRSSSLVNQDPSISYKFVIMVSSQEEAIMDAEVRVFEENELFSTTYTDKKGKFEVQLLRDETYTLEITKEGYYPKRIMIITNVEKGIKKLPSLRLDAELTSLEVFKEAEANDPAATSILDFPSVIIEYDPEIGDFNYREAYSKHITNEIKNIHSNNY